MRYSLRFLEFLFIFSVFVWTMGRDNAHVIAQNNPPTFYKDILPLFGQACIKCHNRDTSQGRYRVDNYDSVMTGGKKGAAVAPGKSADSLLYKMLTGAAQPLMPVGGKLKPEELDLVKRWIDAGAPEGVRPKIPPKRQLTDLEQDALKDLEETITNTLKKLDFENATGPLNDALKIVPWDYDKRAQLADIYGRLGSWMNAIRHWELAMEVDRAKATPRLLDAYKTYANQLLEDADFERAMEFYQKALSLAPNDAEVRAKLTPDAKDVKRDIKLRALLNSGGQALARRRYGSAAQLFESALKIVPDHPTTMVRLAEANMGMRNWDAAIPLLEEVNGMRTAPGTFKLPLYNWKMLGVFPNQNDQGINSWNPPESEIQLVTFDADVYPVLRQFCVGCHTQQTASGGVVLTSAETVLRGHTKGALVTPGKSGNSQLLKILTGQAQPKMPPGGQLPQGMIDLIRRWIDSGAHANEAAAKAATGGKAGEVDVARTHNVGGRQTGWMDARSGDGVMVPVPANAKGILYAFTAFDAPAERPATALMVGSSGGVKVWLNSRLVLESHSHRTFKPDQDSAVVDLRKGRNTMLVKVENDNATAFAVRLSDVPSPETQLLAAYRGQAEDSMSDKKFDVAINAYNKVLEAEPRNYVYRLNLSEAYARKAQWDEAIRACQKAIDLEPNNGLGHLLLAEIYRRQKDYPKAIAQYKKTAEIAANERSRNPRELGVMLECTEGKSSMLVAAQAAAGMAQVAREQNSLDSTFEAHWTAGKVYASQGMLTEALEEMNKALAIKPQHAGLLTEIGLTYRKRGGLYEAVRTFDQALKADPKYVPAVVSAAETYLVFNSESRNRDAIKTYDRAVTLESKNVDLWIAYGNACLREERFAKAFRCYEEALKVAPQHVGAFTAYANALRQGLWLDRAIDLLENRALKAAPNEGGFRNLLAQIRQQRQGMGWGNEKRLEREKVILVIFGKAPPALETVHHPTRETIPHFWQDLRPQGALTVDASLNGYLNPVDIVSATLTGRWGRGAVSATGQSPYPSVFERFRKWNNLPTKETRFVTASAEEKSLACSSDPEHGANFAGTVDAAQDDDGVFQRAKQIMASDAPSLLVVSFNQPNGSDGKKVTPETIKKIDNYVNDLYAATQNSPAYAGKTNFIVVLPHPEYGCATTLVIGPRVMKGQVLTNEYRRAADPRYLTDLMVQIARMLEFDYEVAQEELQLI